MSAKQSSTKVEPAASRDAGSGGSELTAEPHLTAEGASGAEPHFSVDAAELANLLAQGEWLAGADTLSNSVADANAYDVHVALALDTGILPELDSTLDLLTSSHDLFDVPALDLGHGTSDPTTG